jgi:hypothetical protein
VQRLMSPICPLAMHGTGPQSTDSASCIPRKILFTRDDLTEEGLGKENTAPLRHGVSQVLELGVNTEETL